MQTDARQLKEKLTVKAVRNVRRGYEKDEASRGMYRPEVKLDLARSRLLTESYKQTEGEPMVLRRAKAIRSILSRMPIYIQDWERIVGNNVSTPNGIYFGIDMNWRSVKRVVSGEEGQSLLDDAGRAELAQLVAYWEGKSLSDIQKNAFSGDILKYWKYEGTFIWTHWSELGIPDHEKVLAVGFQGIIQEAKARLEEIDRTVPPDYVDQKEFLEAVIIALEAGVTFAGRYAALAREQAKDARAPEDEKRLLKIAEICDRVPAQPARTLEEALQSFFFAHIIRYIEYSSVGIGVRFDKVFGPFLEKDLASGAIARQEALELLKLLWVKFNELGMIYSPLLSAVYGGAATVQAITLGGVDEYGLDVTNEMTHLVLETAEFMQSLEPSICLRYHDRTPDALLSRAVDVIRTGVGYPSLFNDKAILPMLKGWDVPEKDARDYGVSGCVYMELPGKNIVRRAYGGIHLPKVLWWGLHQGVNPVNGEQYGARTRDPLAFTSAEDLMDAYLEQLAFFMERFVKIENTCRALYERYLPRPYLSAITQGCIERGQDCRKWQYPSIVHDICIVAGASNVADALTAVDQVVFKDGKISMQELLDALASNWEGCEHVRRLMLNAPKYGNDHPQADAWAQRVHHGTAEVMARFKNRFGYACRGDGSAVSGTYGAALMCPATPEGRRDGEAFADATLSPVFGADQKGPTAVLKSASKIDTLKTYNHLLNQKFSPDMLSGDMKEVFMNYIRAWGELGISHIQFNIVDRDTLIKAQENPAQYPDLIVRVAGYSAYFADLSRGLQDTIIARTEQSFQ
ncbi:formate C-acetyltransferase [Desulfatibacillum alkenivorans DSM 16219]|jgi:formate C-acetyltransferase|uniref:Formate C-acetyltransferase n=1 Tax=Desulfatibacillum alkenivorans DSM 16219 TaxID=1121393 RepID=A0A1M6UN87_9BACT|nr:pyruvate formate lyase family protein [Desulfatibacillum alkenivorans]SHK70651.1 formate C-acetyltransferase [Desulfatibacillum alkenivorans DSM 16219]